MEHLYELFILFRYLCLTTLSRLYKELNLWIRQ